MAYKEVIVDIRVRLSVPEDNEYDVESYFHDLKTHLTDDEDNYLTQGGETLEEVDDIEVTLLTSSEAVAGWGEG